MTEYKTANHIESLVTSCPQCTAVVYLPSIISVDAIVRCPICHHKYPIRSVLPESIPQLELVFDSQDTELDNDSRDAVFGNSNNSESMIALEKLTVPDVLKNGAKRRTRVRREPKPELSIGEAVENSQAEPATNKPRIRSRQRSILRKNRKLIEVAKIAMGALLALPVAQIIIWWGLGSDPIQIAPSVGKVAPFLVPQKLRELEEDI